jgi:hypothetical protein
VRIGYVETVRALALAAAALVLPVDDLSFATWDDRLHAAAREEGLHLLPERLGCFAGSIHR